MKIARVDHTRCGEPAGGWGLFTYVSVADEMTEQEFVNLCEAAKDKYLANEEAWQKTEPKPAPGYAPHINLDRDRNKTVEEVYAEWHKQKEEYNAYQAKALAHRKSFVVLLVELSNGSIQALYNSPVAFSHELDWGHKHGTTIEYGETKFNDYPPDENAEDYV